MSVGIYVPQYPSARAIFVWPSRRACFPATLYLLLSVADLCCSLVAFHFGVAEGNPFMAWCVARGIFVPGKLLLTLLVASLMAVIYNTSNRWRWTVWAGVFVMVLLDMYHLWALPRMLGLHMLSTLL